MKRLLFTIVLLLCSQYLAAQSCPSTNHNVYCSQPPGAAYGQPHHQGGKLACSPNCGNSSTTGNSNRLPDAICLDGVGCVQPVTNTPGTLLGYWDAYQAFPGASEAYSGWAGGSTVVPDSSVHNNALLANATAGSRNPVFHYTGSRTPNVPELTFASTTPYTSATTSQFIRFPSSQDTTVQQLCPYTVITVTDADYNNAGYEWTTNGTFQFGPASGSSFINMRGDAAHQLKTTTQAWTGNGSSTFPTTQVPNIYIWTCSGTNGTSNLYVDGVQVYTASAIGANPSVGTGDVLMGGSSCSVTPCTGSSETGRFTNGSILMSAIYSGTPSANEIWQINRALVTRYKTTMVPIPQADTNTVCGNTTPDTIGTGNGCSTNADQFLVFNTHVFGVDTYLNLNSPPGSGASATAFDVGPPGHLSAQNLENGVLHFQGYADRNSGGNQTGNQQGISSITCTTSTCTFTVASTANLLVGDFEYPYNLVSSCGTQTHLWGTGQGYSYRIASINGGANTFTVNAMPNLPFTACTGSETPASALAIGGFGGHTWWMVANQNGTPASTKQEGSGIFYSDNHGIGAGGTSGQWTEILSGGFANTGSGVNPLLINMCSSAVAATCFGLSGGYALAGTLDSDPDLVYNDPTFCDTTGAYCGDGRLYAFNNDYSNGGTPQLDALTGISAIDGYTWLGRDGATAVTSSNPYFISINYDHGSEAAAAAWFQGPSITFDNRRHMWVAFTVRWPGGGGLGPWQLWRWGISPQFFPGNATGTSTNIPAHNPFVWEQEVRYPCFGGGLPFPCYAGGGGNWHGKVRFWNGMYRAVFAAKNGTGIGLATSQNGDIFWLGKNRIAKSNIQCVQSASSWTSQGWYAPSITYDLNNLYVLSPAQHQVASTDAAYVAACNFQGIAGPANANGAGGIPTNVVSGGVVNQIGLITIPWHVSAGPLAPEFNWIKY